MKKLSAALFAAAAMTAFGLQSTATAAEAGSQGNVSVKGWPTGCTNGKYAKGLGGYTALGWQAQCKKSNGGHYKATIICRPFDGGDDIYRDAPVWKSSGKSIVFCPEASIRVEGGIKERSY
ncbi:MULTISPECIES: hypothetical protein [Streptomyces]|uniref:Secreted protein n=1 Tax=Streptomyces chartreusis NRRL 3882 TaxID=1079985 RepID=A0A2N9B5K6_STRCX|nr:MULTISPECIES: hypothetical protein [Streptomyces]MYS89851.1 hypothetical protein [Streptomyces sp. SID5464]SOR78626.1 hypothetical protein SCNRRL3882_2093 [Streptomyces chartreusis NRRL 3882]